jgi:hypothetical protein
MESKTQSILTVLAALSARGVTGTLRFVLEPDSELGVEFLFREGKLLFATSNHPGERLAEFLVRRGVISGDQAKASLIEAKRRGRLFHAYLAEQDIISHDLLQDLLYQRTEALLDVILKSEEGQVVFHPLPLAQFNLEVPGVDEELFGRLIRHRQLWPRLFQQFRDPALVLRCKPGIEARLGSMSQAERKLLSVLDGQRPVSKILERRKNRIDLMILLARFIDAGLVEAVEAAEAPAAQAAPEEPAEVRAASAGAGAPQASAPGPAAEAEPLPGLAEFLAGLTEPAAAPAPAQAALTEPLAAALAAPAPAQPALTGPAPAPAPAQPAPAARQRAPDATPPPPIDFELIPVLSTGVDLAAMSITGLMMDDLFLISQIDGRATVRELMWITRMSEEKVRGVLGRMLQHGYVRLKTRFGGQVLIPQQKPQARPASASEPQTQGAAASAEPASAPPAGGSALERHSPLLQHYSLALTAYNEQRYAEAEQLLRKALSMEPRSALLRSRLAVVLLERAGQLRSAEKLAEEAFEEDPLLGQCLEALGLVRLRAGDYNEARRHLDKAVFLDKQHVPAAVRVLSELKNRPPGKRESPEDFWWKVHRLIKLTA